MSVRAHFWLRVVGLLVILAAQFGPHIWPASGAQPVAAKVASVESR